MRWLLPLALWFSLTAATSPTSLMPPDDSGAVFGSQAVLRLSESSDIRPLRLGQRPKVDRSWKLLWHLRWTGRAYEVRDEDSPAPGSLLGHMRLRRLGSHRHLVIMELVEAGSGEGSHVSYSLLWFNSRRSLIGYLQFDNNECDALPEVARATLGLAPADLERCIVRTWPQVEALMRAYAATNPKPLGTARWLRHPPR